MALQGSGPLSLTAPVANPICSNGCFNFSASARPGAVYRLERKTSLAGGDWTAFPLVPGGITGSVTFTDFILDNSPSIPHAASRNSLPRNIM